jgi:phosphatidylserine/phosphatidylglycerophosphate/cardiolipin synthase-like enzyme
MLATEAHRSIELFAPFADGPGVRTIGGALAGATRRGALVTFAHRQASVEAAATLESAIAERGDAEKFRLVSVPSDETYPHLKLMIADGVRAYLGSANLTYAALLTNLELGALVSGPGVRALSRVFDALVEEGSDAAA